jgi:hypothetical protein
MALKALRFVVYSVTWFLFGVLIGLSSLSQTQAAPVPKGYFELEPTLFKVIQNNWDDISIPSVIPGLIEQETCVTLCSTKCWSPFAKLQTSREYGFGLGQLTITKRFNAFEEVKTLHKDLRKWKWEERFDAEYQILAIVAMLRRNYESFPSAEKDLDRFAFALAAYNGGIGGILSDRRICSNTRSCNPDLWFNNVEKTSLKQKTVVSGYGKSFFEINREYPRNILKIRRFKYEPYINPFFLN